MGRDVRWLTRRDFERVLEIDGASFQSPWFEGDFRNALRRRNCIAMVAEEDGEVVGYLVYTLRKGEFEIIRLAVDIVHRRQGVATRLVNRLWDRLVGQRRRAITVLVPETWYGTLCFFRSQYFRAVETLRGEFGDEDGIRFELVRPGASAVAEFDAEDGECEAAG